MKHLVLTACLFAGFSVAACSEDEAVKPKADAAVVPVAETGVVDDAGALGDATGDGSKPIKECENFATENEQLLNAPTTSVAIKKTVVLPQ